MRETRALAILKRLYPKAHWQRIEGSFSGGILDVNVCANGIEIWLEMKQTTRPKTKKGMIKAKIMPGQIGWERLRRDAGGRTFVAMMVDTDFYLLPGSCLLELSKGMSQQRLEELKLDERGLFKA